MSFGFMINTEEEFKELENDYQQILKNEEIDIEEFTKELKEYVFDYFNIIEKEYMIAVDKWSLDEDYAS